MNDCVRSVTAGVISNATNKPNGYSQRQCFIYKTNWRFCRVQFMNSKSRFLCIEGNLCQVSTSCVLSHTCKMTPPASPCTHLLVKCFLKTHLKSENSAAIYIKSRVRFWIEDSRSDNPTNDEQVIQQNLTQEFKLTFHVEIQIHVALWFILCWWAFCYISSHKLTCLPDKSFNKKALMAVGPLGFKEFFFFSFFFSYRVPSNRYFCWCYLA